METPRQRGSASRLARAAARPISTPWWTLLLSVIGVIAIGSGVRLVTMNSDYRAFFSKDNPQVAAFDALHASPSRRLSAAWRWTAESHVLLHPHQGEFGYWIRRDSFIQIGIARFFSAPTLSRAGIQAWAWKDNRTGMFVNWHGNVSFEAFTARP